MAFRARRPSRPRAISIRLPIRLRIACGYAVLLLAIVGGVGLYLVESLRENLLWEVDTALVLRADLVAAEVVSRPARSAVGGDRDGEREAERGIDAAWVESSLRSLGPFDEYAAPGVYVEVLDESGRRVASSPNLPGGSLPDSAALGAAALAGERPFATVPSGRERVRVFAQPLLADGRIAGAVLVGESLHLIDVAVRRTEGALMIAAAVAVGAAFLGGWWLTARALGPVVQVTRVARRIESTGRFDQRITRPATEDELGELAATFNGMIERLDGVFRRQREFLADASHELRGPLAVIRGNLDLLQLDLPDEDRREGAREAAEEVGRMSRLISDLLFLSEVDAQETVQREPVALDAVVRSTLARAREVDGERHVLTLGPLDEVTVLGDRDRLEQLLWNLTENALRYTPEGGAVTLALREESPVAELSVSDTGIGIPTEHLPRLFERFYRVDKARSRERGGTGLGLAIARQIAEAHGGQIRVRSEAGAGSTFTVVLPVMAPR